MRPPRFQLQPSARRWLDRRPSLTALVVATCVAVAVTQWMLFVLTSDVVFAPGELDRLLGLSAETHAGNRNWQFLTFALVHSGPWHLLGTLAPLVLAGREVEPIVGRQHMLGLFLLANGLGGLAQWGMMVLGLMPVGSVFVGVSAGTAAVVAAFSTILPELEITLFFFVFPFRVRAKYFSFILLGLAGLLWLRHMGSIVGPAAMLMGSLVGWAYVRQLGYGNPLAIERYFLRKRMHRQRLERMPAGQFIEEHLDPVLEKLARNGVKSLSRAERRLLQQGSAKLEAGK